MTVDVKALVTDNLDLLSSTIKKRNATGRGSSKKTELYGIKKLRELILDLAVRGLLVPQDPNDEPANVLLEKNAAKKEQLVKDKTVKKPKKLLQITEEEKTFELPFGWTWCRLGEIGQTQTGGTPKKSDQDHYGSFMPFIKPGDINEGVIVSYENDGLSEAGAKSLGRIAPADSVLMVCIGTIGKCARVDREVAFNQQINTVSPYIEIGGYISKALQAPFFQSSAWHLSSSTTLSILNKGKWEQIPIPLAPEAEQHRIVTKVNELITLCDQLEQQQENSTSTHQVLVETLLNALTQVENGQDNNTAPINPADTKQNRFQQAWALIADNFDVLFTTEHSINQLKQTILQLAVMGKLVPQDPDDEPASALLKKIAEEKAQLVKEKKIKKQKPLPPISEEEKPFELPEGWEWCRFGNVAVSRLGKMLDKAKNKGSMRPYLRNTNVQWHKIELDDVKMMQIEDDEVDELLLRRGDLLICEGGYPGRCAIWQDDSMEMYFQKALHRARPLANNSPEYLQSCLTIDSQTGNLDKYFTGATIKHFVGAKLNSYVIPVAPAEEQHRIVTKVDELMTLCDTLLERIKAAQTTQLNLTDAIAEQALTK